MLTRHIAVRAAVAAMLAGALMAAGAARAAISFVGATSASGGSGPTGSIAIGLPAGIAQNDVLLVQVSARGGSGQTITAPAGWALLRRDNNGTSLAQAIYYRVAGASEPATYVWSLGSSDRVAGGMLAYRGVNVNTPVDVHSGRSNGSSTTITASGVTTTFANEVLLGFFGTANGNASVTVTSATMSQQYSMDSGAGPNGVSVAAADETRATAGNTGNRAASGSIAAVNIGQLVALRPAATLQAEYRFDECGYTGAGQEVLDTLGTYSAQAKNGLNTGTPGVVNRFGLFSSYATWAQTAIPLSADWTVSTWFRMPVLSTQQYHVLVSVAGGGDLLYLDRGANYRWGVYTPFAATNGSFQFGTLAAGWHHLVIVGQGNTTSLYIDGAYKERVPRKAWGTLTYIGTSYDYVNTAAAQGFGMPLDEMRIYQGVLDSTQISTLYANQAGGYNADGTARVPVYCGATPGRFNAFEPATPSGSITGVIKTKVAAQSFNLDLVAVNAAFTGVETAFTGDVRVELLDASDNSGALDAASQCRASWTPIAGTAQTVSFTSADSGRKANVPFYETNAWPDVRVRITYPATGPATVIGCSNDDFAIRPASFNFAVTDATWATAGTARTLNNTAASGGVVHKAGQPLTLTATAVNALGNVTSNYAGTPVASITACTLPAGCTAGVMNAGSWSAVGGTLTSTTANYTETGVFTMQLADQTFANVDAADGSTTAERYIVSGATNVGRFVPDHFDLAPANTPAFKTFNDTSCATRSFTYIGQPFGYATAPQAAVAAKNAAGATTVNYAGSLWKLSASGVTQTYASVPATPALSTTLGAPTVASNNNGTGFITANAGDTLAYARVTVPPYTSPFNADITLTLSVQDASENAANQGIIGTTTAALFDGGGSGIAFDAGNAFRYGRLRLSNAHGSERLPLNVPVRAEYFNGSIFVSNAADNCTGFTLASDLSLSNWQRNLNPGETTPGPAAITLASGVSAIALSAPGVGNSGSVDLTLAAPNWLQFNWSGTVGDPTARATFGIYRKTNDFIYMREAY